jgi:hypothetical protein
MRNHPVEFVSPRQAVPQSDRGTRRLRAGRRAAALGETGSEPEAHSCATLSRTRYVRSASGHLFTIMATLLPPDTRARWREEWLGELRTLPARRSRDRFAVHTTVGVPRLAATARRPVPGSRQVRP